MDLDPALREIAEFLSQLGSGPGADPSHAVPRFVIPAIFWSALAFVAFRQYRKEHERRDQLLGVAAAVAAGREIFQLVVEYGSHRGLFSFESVVIFYPPLEHALELGAQVLAGYAFLASFRRRSPSHRAFLVGGLGVTALLYAATAISWAAFAGGGRPAGGPGPRLEFAAHWGDLAFRVAGVAAMSFVVTGLVRVRDHGLAPRIAALAFLGFLLDHALMLFSILAGGRHAWFLAPLRHNLHMWGVPALLGVYWHELTETVRAAEARLQASQKLESLGLLAGGVAHDFNNLLFIISGNLDLALADVPPGRTHDLLTKARKGTTRAAELTTQLLAYAGRGRSSIAPVDLSALAADTATLVRSTLPRDARLVVECPLGLPRVLGDATQLRQLLMNLLLNAGQAMDGRQGEIAVRIAAAEVDRADLSRCRVGQELAPGRFLAIEVADQGAGMGEEMLSRIFDPFFTTRTGGRGLGLAVVLGVVKSHRGALSVESAPGAGTAFRALLPLDGAGSATAPAAPTARA